MSEIGKYHRVRRTLGAAYAAAPLVGLTIAFAVLRQPALALLCGAIASGLTLTALICILRQEERR